MAVDATGLSTYISLIHPQSPHPKQKIFGVRNDEVRRDLCGCVWGISGGFFLAVVVPSVWVVTMMLMPLNGWEDSVPNVL